MDLTTKLSGGRPQNYCNSGTYRRAAPVPNIPCVEHRAATRELTPIHSAQYAAGPGDIADAPFTHLGSHWSVIPISFARKVEHARPT